MRSFVSAIVALGLISSVSSVATAQTAGDWVLGNYRNAGYWFPGIIEQLNKGNITVRYDDGDRETLPLSQVRPYDWMIGMKVECNFQGAGVWYPGRIASLAGGNIGIDYDDGDKEATNTGRCRSR